MIAESPKSKNTPDKEKQTKDESAQPHKAASQKQRNKRSQKGSGQSSSSKDAILSLIEQHVKDDTSLASKIFKEATTAGVKGKITNVKELISCVEKTASESKLRKFHAKLGAAIIVGGQA